MQILRLAKQKNTSARFNLSAERSPARTTLPAVIITAGYFQFFCSPYPIVSSCSDNFFSSVGLGVGTRRSKNLFKPLTVNC